MVDIDLAVAALGVKADTLVLHPRLCVEKLENPEAVAVIPVHVQVRSGKTFFSADTDAPTDDIWNAVLGVNRNRCCIG